MSMKIEFPSGLLTKVEGEAKKEKPYSVNYWGSHPDEENDDCHTGVDFDSLEEAIAAFKAKPSEVCSWMADHDPAFIEIDGIDDADLPGLGIERVRKNPIHRKSKDDDSDWQHERAMQAGMAFGCQGYNEEMGFD